MKKTILLAIAAFSTASSFACPESFFKPESSYRVIELDSSAEPCRASAKRAQILVSALLALTGLELMELHYNGHSAAFTAGALMALGGSTYLLAQL